MRIGIFPGTFDPVTEGHLDIIRRSRRILDRVIIAVARGHHKDTLFTVEERVAMVETCAESIDGVEVLGFDGLLIDLARKRGASAIIRGLRFVSDFDYEFQLALMNRRLDPEVESLFFMPSAKYSYLNSSVIKEVMRLGGDVSGLVPPSVLARMEGKFRS